MIDELKSATSTNFADRRATTTPTCQRDDEQLTAAGLLETAAAGEDAPIEQFSTTFNVRPELRTDINEL